MDFDKLDEARREAAEAMFESYDFEAYRLDETSGWEFTSGSGPTEWSRPLFFADPEDPDAETTTGVFRVNFPSNSADVIDVTASINGQDIGRVAQPPRP